MFEPPPVDGLGSSLRPGIMFETDSPMLLAVSRTCSTTRLITLFAAGGVRRIAAAAAAPAAAVATAARFATFLTVRLVARFAAPLRAAAERFAEDVARFAPRFLAAVFFFPALFLAELFFAAPFFEERFAELRLDDRFFDEDFERLREDDFLEPLEEDRFLVAMRFLLMQNGNDGSCVA